MLGLPALRAEIANQWSAAYGGVIADSQVAITQGCNQAFCAVVATLAGAGDEVILPTPWYFNHEMWLTMQGVKPVPLPAGAGLIPQAAQAAALITPRTRAIVLVSPNNPGGSEYPAQTLTEFRDLARAHGIALIVDETYRDFDSRTGRPHDLFADPDWADTFIHLYSFSKTYRLTGHRVGAIVAAEDRLIQVEKFLDTVAICPSQLGQIGALWGMQTLPDWKLLGCGAYFAYVEHPFDASSVQIAKRLVHEASILLLPGTMFQPKDAPAGHRQFRIAFANADVPGISQLFARLSAFRP